MGGEATWWDRWRRWWRHTFDAIWGPPKGYDPSWYEEAKAEVAEIQRKIVGGDGSNAG